MIRILHVDDNPDDLEITKWQLRRLTKELDVCWAESSGAALNALEKEKFDCVLCDYQIPDMNGLELLRALRNRSISTSFIFLTRQGNEEVAAAALREGADDYFTKDVGLAYYDRLLNSIHRVVETRQRRLQHRWAEKALLESEARYRSLFENSIDAVFIITTNGRLVDINQSGADLFGYNREELTSMTLHSLFLKSSHKKRFYKELDKKGYVKDYPMTLRGKAGNRIYALITASVNTDKEGNFVGFQGIIRDVTDQKKTGEELIRKERKYEDLVDRAAVGIAVTNTRGVGTYVNDALCKMMGYPREELIGQHFASFLHPDDKRRILKIFWSAFIDPTEKYVLEFRVRHRDGHYIWIRCKPTVSWYKRKIEGFNGILVDITELKELEEKAGELETRLADRNQYVAAANEESEAIENYLTHKLRPQLQHIEKMNQMILDNYSDALDPKVLSCLHEIQETGDRISEEMGDTTRNKRNNKENGKRDDVDLSA